MRCLLALLLSTLASAQLPHATTGDLLVSSFGNDRLLRLAADGTQLAEVSYPGLARPRGIVVGDDATVYLISQNSNEVLVLDAALQYVRRFPTGPVISPTGAALGPNGNLFVAGFSSSSVGEFQLDGTLVRTYSDALLGRANCVAFLGDGSFYVASASTGTVVHFGANGQVVRAFTGFGLSSPMGLAIWQAEIYVAGGGSGNIAVFDLAGNPQRELRFPSLTGPQGIAVSVDGTFVASSFFTHNCVWFRGDGTLLRALRPPSSQQPRGLARLSGVAIDANGGPRLGSAFGFAVRSPHDGAIAFLTGLALGRSPGLPLPDGRVFPLNLDPLFEISVSGAAEFQNFVGQLDAAGNAQLSLNLPDIPPLRGLQVHAAAITLDPLSPVLFRQVSAPVAWQL